MVEWAPTIPCTVFRAWPRGLKREVLDRFGSHPWQDSCDAFPRTPEGYRDFRDRLVRGVKAKTELTNHYLRSDRWDFMAQVFSEAHCAGHQCWHLHDGSHPSHDPETASVIGDPIRDVYMAIDAAIGDPRGSRRRHDRRFPGKPPHGRNIGAETLLPRILVRLHAAEPLLPPREDAPETLLSRARDRVPGWAKRVLRPVRDRLRGWRSERRGMVPHSCSRIDMAKSRCFPQENGYLVSGIRVNLAGREPAGRVRPGEGDDSFCRNWPGTS